MNKWTKRYLQLAKEISTWSKDPNTQIGSICVGKSGQILSQGFNGFSRGVRDHSHRLKNRTLKNQLMVHAEHNCIFNATLNGVSLKNSTMYVYGLPVCSECAKGVIQVGIKKVIACHSIEIPEKWKESVELALLMMKEAGVQSIHYTFDFEPVAIEEILKIKA